MGEDGKLPITLKLLLLFGAVALISLAIDFVRHMRDARLPGGLREVVTGREGPRGALSDIDVRDGRVICHASREYLRAGMPLPQWPDSDDVAKACRDSAIYVFDPNTDEAKSFYDTGARGYGARWLDASKFVYNTLKSRGGRTSCYRIFSMGEGKTVREVKGAVFSASYEEPSGEKVPITLRGGKSNLFVGDRDTGITHVVEPEPMDGKVVYLRRDPQTKNWALGALHLETGESGRIFRLGRDPQVDFAVVSGVSHEGVYVPKAAPEDEPVVSIYHISAREVTRTLRHSYLAKAVPVFSHPRVVSCMDLDVDEANGKLYAALIIRRGGELPRSGLYVVDLVHLEKHETR